MNPGIELDADIARKIFKLVVMVDSETGKSTMRDLKSKKWVSIPTFSSNTDVAYSLIDHFSRKGFFATINSAFNDSYTEWQVIFHSSDKNPVVGATGKSAAHAICLAALGLNDLLNK